MSILLAKYLKDIQREKETFKIVHFTIQLLNKILKIKLETNINVLARIIFFSMQGIYIFPNRREADLIKWTGYACVVFSKDNFSDFLADCDHHKNPLFISQY